MIERDNMKLFFIIAFAIMLVIILFGLWACIILGAIADEEMNEIYKDNENEKSN